MDNEIKGEIVALEVPKTGVLEESPGVKSGKRVAGFIALANLIGMMWYGAIKIEGGKPILEDLVPGLALLAIVAGTLLGITAIENAVKSFAEAKFGRK